MNESPSLPTKEEISWLPQWAKVAYAAECANLVSSLIEGYFRKEDVVAVYSAVEVAAHLAATAGHSRLTSYEIEQVAAMAEDVLGAPGPPPMKDDEGRPRPTVKDVMDAVATSAAMAVRAAANVIKGDFTFTDDLAYAAASSAVSAAAAFVAHSEAPAADPVVKRITSRFGILLMKANAENWTDETPVPPSAFGLPEVPIPDAPHFDIWIDPGDAEVEHIQELFAALSELNQAHGGSGLTFVNDEEKAYVMEGGLI